MHLMNASSHECVDSLILSYAGEHWRKVAMIISKVLLEFERTRTRTRTEADEYEIADRIRALVEDGKLEAQGNLSLWRNSEVRLPD
jgi:hypothetical protein